MLATNHHYIKLLNPRIRSDAFFVSAMTSKLRIVLIILLSLQTKIIQMKPSNFLRSPFYVDFSRSDIGLYNKMQEEESLEKKANSIELEGMIFSSGYNASFTKKSFYLVDIHCGYFNCLRVKGKPKTYFKFPNRHPASRF